MEIEDPSSQHGERKQSWVNGSGSGQCWTLWSHDIADLLSKLTDMEGPDRQKVEREKLLRQRECPQGPRGRPDDQIVSCGYSTAFCVLFLPQ
jgi:hypothetical protein